MLDIGIVTSVWGDYGRFLPEWVASVQAQTCAPTCVTVLDAGADDLQPAREALHQSTLPWQIVTETCHGMGHARNAAVAATPTEWVMHLDADDTLLPHALADIAELAPDADVVSIGAVHGSHERCFPKVSAAKLLRQQHGVFSCGAYRRSLWQQRPYITANDFVDSPLWVGFAHLGARFVGTRRSGFIYRMHADSHSRTVSHAERLYARQQWQRLCARWDDGQYTDARTS